MLGGVILKSIVLLAAASLTQGVTYTKDTSKCGGYSATKVHTNKQGLTADLHLKGKPCHAYGVDYTDLTLQVTYEENDRLHVKISDKNQKAWQTPEDIVPRAKGHGAKTPALKFTYTQDPFSFKVVRTDNHDVIFDTTGHNIVFEDQYLELTSKLPLDHTVYGLGEQVDSFKRDPGTVTTMWARDTADPVRENLYSSHPVYVELRDGNAHGVLLLNNHGMDVFLNDTSITYKTLGGVLDYYFFAGKEPTTVVEQYTDLIGKPTMQPYWAMGFHQCRYGFTSIWEVEQTVANYSKAGIPLETMWTDIDYMDGFKDFTTDPINFPEHEMRRLVNELHNNNQHYILILDPAISRNKTYSTYTDGLKEDVFIKNRDGSVYYGQVWPGYTAFPDWFAPNTQKWWTKNIGDFLDKLPLDGLWIDMNEASSFCFGSCGTGVDPSIIPELPWLDPNAPADPIFTPSDPDFNLLNPPYTIRNGQGNLSDHALETNATHHGGIVEYTVHNLYGHMEGYATRQALLAHYPHKRPFVLGRSTFPGSGVNEGKWTGDNNADWNYLAYSIPGVLSFQLFGIPYVGADICGFNSNTTEQLCNRWMQLGSFYTFMRNHNVKGANPQEAYRWPSVAEATKYSLNIRYSLFPYLYTLLQRASVKGTPILLSQSYVFPKDKSTYANDQQFFYGPAVMITPVLTENATSVEGYFPKGNWYSWDSIMSTDHSHAKYIKGPKTVDISAPLGHIPVHILGGNVIVAQKPAYTTTESRKNPFFLIVALDENNEAQGSLYLDEGEAIHQPHTSQISFSVKHGILTSSGDFGYKVSEMINDIYVASPSGVVKHSAHLSLNHPIKFHL